MMLSGEILNIRLAASPTIGTSSGEYDTTEGVIRDPFLSAKRIGNPESTTPTKEFVVPRSIPNIFSGTFIMISNNRVHSTHNFSLPFT